MKSCKQYEIELSAMLDGESDPATAVALMDHVSRCDSCRGFYQELRSFQSLVDDMPQAAEESGPAPEPARRRWSWTVRVPRWAWGAAAALVIAIGSYAAGSRQILDVAGGGSNIESFAGEGGVDDEQFVELASDVLRADRRHQQQLYRLLEKIETIEGSGETLVIDEFDDGERPENYNEMFAVIGGRRVVN
jgi:hypothetical protein